MDIYKNISKYYDLDPRKIFNEDLFFYEEFAKLSNRKSILDLGSGTGRLSIHLAEKGFDVTAFDSSMTMLEILHDERKKSQTLMKNIHLVKGEYIGFSINKKFDLIIVSLKVLHTLANEKDVFNFLKNIKNHLASNGFLILEVFRPYQQHNKSLVFTPTTQWEVYDEDSGRTITKVDDWCETDIRTQMVYAKQTFKINDPKEGYSELKNSLQVKFFFDSQIRDLLKKANFFIAAEYGWFDRKKFTDEKDMLFVCKNN